MNQGTAAPLTGWLLCCLLASCLLTACSRAAGNAPQAEIKHLSHTVFTEKVGAYLVYQPLKAGQPSEFALHLTDLAEGTPVGQAEINFTARAKGNQVPTHFKAQASKTTGVYTAQVVLPKSGEYDIEFEIKHEKFAGRLTMADFDVD